MPRRTPYTEVEKHHQVRPAHIRGMSDVVFKGFKCLNPECHNFLFVREDEISKYFEIECPVCQYVHKYGEETKFYEYELKRTADNHIIQAGAFTILHDDYIKEAGRYKYCIICCARKPLEFFGRHSARRASGRQGECRLCKQIYNSIKNQTRTTDQHREAAQKRRLHVELTGGDKIDSKAIYERYNHRCFMCDKDLSSDLLGDTERGGALDHTLPALYLWPLTTANATLLCLDHNAAKAERWPSAFYPEIKLRQLVVKTGFDYDLVAGEPQFSPVALDRLHDGQFVEAMLQKYAPYVDEIIRLRNRVLNATGFDFLTIAPHISPDLIVRADAARS